jgi:hypothetical protein
LSFLPSLNFSGPSPAFERPSFLPLRRAYRFRNAPIGSPGIPILDATHIKQKWLLTNRTRFGRASMWLGGVMGILDVASNNYYASSATVKKGLIGFLKLASWVICICILANNTLLMSHWNEHRGVTDDLGYLRQAHLFQRFGLGGLDTDARRDNDHFYVQAQKNAGFDDSTFVAHNYMPATHKLVLQSPPGVGFLLAFFPEGFQVIPLYVVCSALVLIFAVFLIGLSPTLAALATCTAFGWASIIFMVNPAKASYSAAPTFTICAVAGWITALFFCSSSPRKKLVYAALVGFLLGVSVNFRIANLFLTAGYCFGFLIWFAKSRRLGLLFEASLFTISFVLGMIPTLVSNAINAGSPFKTTYGAGDAVLPQYSAEVVRYYLSDPQCLVIALLCALAVWTFIYRREFAPRAVAGLCSLTLVWNLAFFLTHPLHTQYYLMPFTMLSFWSLLFCLVIEPQSPTLSIPMAGGKAAGLSVP